jgi:ribosome-binding ATPase YchF (GTP1/OBG family)
LNILIDAFGKTNTSGFTYRFDAGSDINAIAEYIIVSDYDIPDMNADTKLIWRICDP